MTENTVYYGIDLALLPFRTIFGKQLRKPLRSRLQLAFRKIIGRRFTPVVGYVMDGHWHPLEIENLPSSIQEEFTEKTRSMQGFGFRSMGINKGNEIGSIARYTCYFVSDDRTTSAQVGVYRITVGATSKLGWAVALRTYRKDGATLVTGNGTGAAEYLFKEYYRREYLPETTPIARIVARHRERLLDTPLEEIILTPDTDTLSYFIARSHEEAHGLLGSPPFRRLSDAEVERLRRTTVNFD